MFLFLCSARRMSYNLRPRSVGEALEQEEPEIVDFGGESSNDESDNVEQMSNDDTDEASDLGEIEAEVENPSKQSRASLSRARGRPITTMKGKNGYTWSVKPVERNSNRRSSTRIYIPGPANDALQCEEIVQFWEVLFTTEMRELIVKYTNIKIDSTRREITDKGGILQTYHHTTDLIEINGFIGLLYYAGIWRVNHIGVKELWSNTEGYNMYRATMPGRRFIFLSQSIRFDDKTRRPQNNKFACIEELWNMFIEKCKWNYKPHNFCTVDEQLLSFRGRCGFRVYIKSKPDRYGLKLVTLNDAKTFYMINAVPYTGKVHIEKGLSVSEDVFFKVTAPIHGTERSVICDNWFTSIPLIEKAFKDPYKMKITGTIRSNKREIPLEMKIAGDAETGKYGFHENITLLSWTPRKNKIVLVASSYVTSTENEAESHKPLIISHYNTTKGGTDVFDKLCHSYTVSRGTKRWPLRFFFGMLDQAAVNSRILHTCHKMNDSEKANERLSGRESQKQIAFYLLKPQLQRRLETPSLRVGIRKSIESILSIDSTPTQEHRSTFEKRVRCALCDRKKDHKTKAKCPSCSRAMCDDHRAYLCIDCAGVQSIHTNSSIF
ncbi:piggyBac transposable element-derived protein 4-like [Onthophagus taurus]|uniref:piggyBac transposable element-derived protein 4-like n=1 Tax=Onthophagus taurus TaxID=166361 RepID=UPI0039BEAD96